MNGTNKNMQIKKIALFIKYLKELLDISFTSPLASLHFYISLLLYKSICFASLPYLITSLLASLHCYISL